MEMIDGHVHVHEPGNPIPDHELFGDGWGATIEELVAEQDEHGLDGAVLVPTTAHEANLAYAAESADRYPDRFAVVGVHDPSVEDQARAYRETLGEYDVQGLRCMGLGGEPGDEPQDLAMWPLLEEMADRGHNLWMYPQPDEYELVDAVAGALPDLNVVYNLLGYPQPAALEPYEVDEHGRPTLPTMGLGEGRREQLLESGERSNTYVMFGGHFQYSDERYPYRDMVEHSQALFDSFGPDGTFFMTDWPWTREVPGYADLLELIDVHLPDISGSERARILGGTVRELLEF